MPNIKSAIKRAKTNESRRALRASQKSTFRTTIKKIEDNVGQMSAEEAKSSLVEAQKALDKAVSKGLVHKNHAARKKARLAKKLNAINV